MKALELTDNERIAICFAAELALSDQWNYLQIGNPDQDYGDDWPNIAKMKAVDFDNLAGALRKMGFITVAADCNSIAKSLRASAHEYKNPEVGN